MSFIKYRVKFMESFKDGNILEGRLFTAGEVADLDEQDKIKIANSGGVFDSVEMLVPNPLHKPVEADSQTEQKAKSGKK